MIKSCQLCFWIAVAIASTAFAQTPSSPAAATDSTVSQKPVAADGPLETSTDLTAPNKRPGKANVSTSRPAVSEAPVTLPADAMKPAAAPDTAGTKGVPHVQVTSPASNRRTTSRVAIIDLEDLTSQSDVIRQVVEALEKQGIARQNAPVDPAAAGESGLSARIATRSDMKVEDVMSLVRSLQGHNVQRMSFTKPINDRNVVTVLAPADTPWPTIDNLRTMVTAKKQFAVDVQIANPEQAPNSYDDGSRSRYGYSSSRFTENDLPARSTETNKQAVSETRIFMLRYADAKVMAQTLAELFSEEFGVVPDERVNAIIVRGDPSQLKQVEAIVELVDDENGKQPAVVGRSEKIRVAGGESPIRDQKHRLTVNVDVPLVPAATVRNQISDLDLVISQAANSLRSVRTAAGEATEDNAKRKAQLRAVVRKTFLARQELQRAELAEFAARLERIQQSIEMRDRIADQIIDRRVEELLDPNAKSDTTAASTRNTRNASSRLMAEQMQQSKQTQSTTERDTEIIESRSTDGTTILRHADEFRKLLFSNATLVAEQEARVEAFKAHRDASSNPATNGIDEEQIKRQEQLLDAARSDQRFAEKEYRTQIQLLESEVETVNLVVETAKQELVRTEELVKAKAAPSHELNQRERELAAALHRLERAKTLLNLYLDAAEGI